MLGRPKAIDEHARRMALYQRGLTDKEMAQELCLSVEAVKKWRMRSGLEPHRAESEGRISTVALPAPKEMLRAAEQMERTLTLPKEPREWRTMLHVDIASGKVTENRLPWWLRKEERAS